MKNNLGLNLAKLRKKNRYSRKEIAQILGVNEMTVGAYERGEKNPPIDRIIKIAELFKVSIDILVGGDVEDSTTDDTTIKIALPPNFDLGYMQESKGIVELVLTKFNKSYADKNDSDDAQSMKGCEKMTIEEFTTRTRYKPDDSEFMKILIDYQNSGFDNKNDFCYHWKIQHKTYPIKLDFEVVAVGDKFGVCVEDIDVDGIFVTGFATADDVIRAVNLIQAGKTDSDFNGEFKSIDSNLAAIRLYEKIWNE